MLSPVIESLADEFKEKITFAKVDVDKSAKLASLFKIMSIPTLLFFKKGRLAERVVGFIPKPKLKEILRRVFGV